MTPLAHIESPFKTKFGVPRQAGLVDLEARIVFEPEYRVPEAVRGLEEFEYIWLIWGFHLNRDTGGGWSPTVRPPRLGGNKRVGVFATRSPFRPNPIGLSSVRLLGITYEAALGPVLHVSGADLADGTPIFDIKPYVAYADSHPDARSGFAQSAPVAALQVEDPDGLLSRFPDDDRRAVIATLANDPRPHYHDDPSRIYAMSFANVDIKFRVDGQKAVIVDVCVSA